LRGRPDGLFFVRLKKPVKGYTCVFSLHEKYYYWWHFASYFKIMVYLYSMATIHDNIRQLRKSKGWTQAQLAQRLRTSQKVITSYETSRKTPPVSRLSALAAVLNVSIEELIGAEPLKIKETLSHTHRNSRMARLQEFYEKLSPEEQRVILKQVKTLAGHGA
jgi:transcriptional regulator with XRE-family HTH domain